MINFKHLHYFLVVAREGTIAKASEILHLTPQTISAQISLLEEYLGELLFDRVGRNLELTESGKLVLSYADEIFSLGGELEEMVRNLAPERQMIFKVGITDVIPKSIAYRLVEPAFEISDSIRLICREGDMKELLAELAVHKLDLVIADQPMPSSVKVRGFNHELGESGISFFAVPDLVKKLKGEFPQCLNGAPLLLPGDSNPARNRLSQWLGNNHIYPVIVGEFDDSALMKAFGQRGKGVFIAPSAIEKEVSEQLGVSVIGNTTKVKENFYAISIERKISHPAIAAIQKSALKWLV